MAGRHIRPVVTVGVALAHPLHLDAVCSPHPAAELLAPEVRSVPQHLVLLVLVETPPIAHLRHLGGGPSLADSVTKRGQASIHTLPRKSKFEIHINTL